LQKAGAHSQRVCAARAAVIAGAGSLGRKLIFTNRQDCSPLYAGVPDLHRCPASRFNYFFR